MCLSWLVLAISPLVFGIQFEPLHEFKTLDFNFSSSEERADCLANGTYDPSQNIPTAIRVWNDTIFVAVPRISGFGVPYTLTKLEGKLLTPFPNANANWLGNPASLRSVTAMEIDSFARLWVLDSGRYGTDNLTVNGPASIVIIDLQTATTLHTFMFPNDVVSYFSSSLQDLTLDQTHLQAFVSDRGGDGALIVYDYAKNWARRFIAVHMSADNSSVIVINNTAYPAIQWGITGLTLAPDTDTLYFSPVNRGALLSVPTAHLRSHFALPMKIPSAVVNITQQIKEVAPKSQSSRFIATNTGTLYFGLLSQSAIGRFQFPGIDPTVEIVASDNITLEWVDSMCIANGLIYVLSNKMHLFWNNSMNWDDTNYRILTASTNERSYIDGERAPTNPPTPGSDSSAANSVFEDVLIGASAGVMGLALGALLTSCFVRQQSGWNQPLLEPVNTGWSVSDPQRPALHPRDSIKSSKDHVVVNGGGLGQGNINGSSGREKGWLFSE